MMSLAVAKRIQRAAQESPSPTLQQRAVLQVDRLAQRVGIGFDYENQAWVVDGRYVSCGHPETMDCGCFDAV